MAIRNELSVENEAQNNKQKTYYNGNQFSVTVFPRQEKKLYDYQIKEVIIWIVQVHFKKTNADLYFREKNKHDAQMTAMMLADDIIYGDFEDESPERLENYITSEYFGPIFRCVDGSYLTESARPEEVDSQGRIIKL